MSLANLDTFKDRSALGVLKRFEAHAAAIAALRDQLLRLQVRIDGGTAPDFVAVEAATGLKPNMDHVENDMRAISRTMNALEELL